VARASGCVSDGLFSSTKRGIVDPAGDTGRINWNYGDHFVKIRRCLVVVRIRTQPASDKGDCCCGLENVVVRKPPQRKEGCERWGIGEKWAQQAGQASSSPLSRIAHGRQVTTAACKAVFEQLQVWCSLAALNPSWRSSHRFVLPFVVTAYMASHFSSVPLPIIW